MSQHDCAATAADGLPFVCQVMSVDYFVRVPVLCRNSADAVCRTATGPVEPLGRLSRAEDPVGNR